MFVATKQLLVSMHPYLLLCMQTEFCHYVTVGISIIIGTTAFVPMVMEHAGSWKQQSSKTKGIVMPVIYTWSHTHYCNQ